MSSLGKRKQFTYGGAFKKARPSTMARSSTMRGAMSGRYNRAMSSRFQRAPGTTRETGYVDVASASYALDTTGSVTLLNTVAQGAGVLQRVGKKIILKSLQCRGVIANNSTAAGNDVAYLIVYDKRPTGALPAVTDILVTANSNSFNNDANSGRFVVLKRFDDVLLGNAAAAASYTDCMQKSADFYLDLGGKPTAFKAAGTGAIGDIEQGALYLVTVGNSVAGTAAASATLAFRTRFIDV